MRDTPAVSILTSGIGLGVYIPALLIQQQMQALGVEVDVETLEGYYTPEGQQRHLTHRQAYHDNFQLALVAHRMARGVADSLDQPRVDELLDRWTAQDRRHFIVWSGFWLPLLERYRALCGGALRVDCCRIDAVVSASFRVHEGLARDATEIWLWNWAERRTVNEIPVTAEPPLEFEARQRRLVVHGGGWNLGTYGQARDRLRDTTTWAADVVVHAAGEIPSTGRDEDRTFMVDPAWRTWHRDGRGRHVFPPFGPVGGSVAPEPDTHALHRLIRHAKAIVSKPGGGTLIDSLASETPVLLLEPYGYAEERNGALWEHLGFGIPFAKWCQSGCGEDVLAGLHQNLRRRVRGGPDYPRRYVERLEERPA